eukprot:gnl/TRDRNA2_/TRDRNA2_194174_c0_seq1.p1 gnl/TRDRNA2_/TRDRNA2_194174_c0~~gnl/TRDRNA2_/TRDRNA2_194174_c0_seq1.p1  ORF type:complete len:169 (-),score=30.63 gnl/TRDRNA2_/TRDRNA2_194174_c0_seq1:50-556(-)
MEPLSPDELRERRAAWRAETIELLSRQQSSGELSRGCTPSGSVRSQSACSRSLRPPSETASQAKRQSFQKACEDAVTFAAARPAKLDLYGRAIIDLRLPTTQPHVPKYIFTHPQCMAHMKMMEYNPGFHKSASNVHQHIKVVNPADKYSLPERPVPDAIKLMAERRSC